MALTLRAQSFSPNNLKSVTKVASDAAIGAASVSVENSVGISPSDFLAVGTMGGGSSEMVGVSSVSGETVTLASPTLLLHKRNEQVFALYGNSMQLYSAPVPTDGSIPPDSSFGAIGGPVPISVDQLFTTLTDPNGSSSFWYKFVYVNSLTAAATALADASPVRGSNYGHYVTLYDIRVEAGMTEASFVSDQIISLKRDDAENEVNGVLVSMVQLPLSSPYPPLVVSITRMLAAGMLLTHQYGLKPAESSKDGSILINHAHDLLDQVSNRSLTLLDYKFQPIAVTPLLDGWPNDLTSDYNQYLEGCDPNGEIGGSRLFHISEWF